MRRCRRRYNYRRSETVEEIVINREDDNVKLIDPISKSEDEDHPTNIQSVDEVSDEQNQFDSNTIFKTLRTTLCAENLEFLEIEHEDLIYGTEDDPYEETTDSEGTEETDQSADDSIPYEPEVITLDDSAEDEDIIEIDSSDTDFLNSQESSTISELTTEDNLETSSQTSIGSSLDSTSISTIDLSDDDSTTTDDIQIIETDSTTSDTETASSQLNEQADDQSTDEGSIVLLTTLPEEKSITIPINEGVQLVQVENYDEVPPQVNVDKNRKIHHLREDEEIQTISNNVQVIIVNEQLNISDSSKRNQEESFGEESQSDEANEDDTGTDSSGLPFKLLQTPPRKALSSTCSSPADSLLDSPVRPSTFPRVIDDIEMAVDKSPAKPISGDSPVKQQASTSTPSSHASSSSPKTPRKFSEKLKAEASVVRRITELQKEGMWYDKRLPKAQEEPRRKTHWDYVLEEMLWLGTDFALERKWKRLAARKCARMVERYHANKKLAEEKAQSEEKRKVKKIAAFMAKEIRNFWSNVKRLIEYKEDARVDALRKKVMDQHLNYIVGQTEKYTTMIAGNLELKTSNSLESVGNETNSTISSSSARRFHEIDISDDEFLPTQPSDDDEETIALAEANEAKYVVTEIDLLKKESEMSISDLLDDLPPDYIRGFLPETDENNDEKSTPSVSVQTLDVSPAPLRPSSSSKNPPEAKLNTRLSKRLNESSVSEDEKKARFRTRSGRLDQPISDSVDSTTIGGRSLRPRKPSGGVRASPSKLTGIGGRQSLKWEETNSDGIESDETNEESDYLSAEEMLEESGEDEEDGQLSSLLKPYDIEKDVNKMVDDELNSVAALAESFQPKGYTLSSTNVVTKVPVLLKHKLREYQHIGLDWLVALHDKKLNGILADEMGLGKTIQTIALLAHLAAEKGDWGPHLIIVPTSVILNWEIEILKWFPGCKVLTYYGSIKERRVKRTGWTKPNTFHVCITSYKIVIQDHQIFRRKRWRYLILDEAQNIKNFKSQRWQLLLNFSTQRRLLLTGTPLQNNLMELWSLMHFLMPNVFQSHREFKEWFSNPMLGMIEGNNEFNENVVKRLHKVLRPFLLRRLKSEVEKQLPQKFEHVLVCRLSKRQRYLYEEFMSRAKTKETLQTGNLLSVINVLMQLRKVCNHPNLFESRPIISPLQTNGLLYEIPSILWNLPGEKEDNRVNYPFWDVTRNEEVMDDIASERIFKLQPKFYNFAYRVPNPAVDGRIKRNNIFSSSYSREKKGSSDECQIIWSSMPHNPTPEPVREKCDANSIQDEEIVLLDSDDEEEELNEASNTKMLLLKGGFGSQEEKEIKGTILMPTNSFRRPNPPKLSKPFVLFGFDSTCNNTLEILHDGDFLDGISLNNISNGCETFYTNGRRVTEQDVVAIEPVKRKDIINPRITKLSSSNFPYSLGKTATGDYEYIMSEDGVHFVPVVQQSEVHGGSPLSNSILYHSSEYDYHKKTVREGLTMEFEDEPDEKNVSIIGDHKVDIGETPKRNTEAKGTTNGSIISLSSDEEDSSFDEDDFKGPPRKRRRVRSSISCKRNKRFLPQRSAPATPSSALVSPLLNTSVALDTCFNSSKAVTSNRQTSTTAGYIIRRKLMDRNAVLHNLRKTNERKSIVPIVYGVGALHRLKVVGRVNKGRRKLQRSSITEELERMEKSYFAQSYNVISLAQRFKNGVLEYFENGNFDPFLLASGLMEAIWTVDNVLVQLDAILKRFIILTPAVTSPIPQIRVYHPNVSEYADYLNFQETLRNEMKEPLEILRPTFTAMSTQFPDPRLIQYDCGKLQVLDGLLRRLSAEGHRVLIFTQMSKMLDVLEVFLNYHGYIYLRLDGATKIEERQHLMERFNSDRRIFVFILSTRSGGIGVNLTGADTVIFYDSDWNPTMDAQAQDRCHRIGQTRDVHIYRLVSEKTVEENILKKSNQKRLLGELAIEGGNFTTVHFKKNTIQELFHVGEGENAQTRMAEILSEPVPSPIHTTTEDITETGDIDNERQEINKNMLPESDNGRNKSATLMLESALAAAEDENDVEAAKTVRAEAAAELDEFDENIPFEEESVATDELVKVENEIQFIMQELSTVERYAIKFMEDTFDDWSAKDSFATALKEVEQRRIELELQQEESNRNLFENELEIEGDTVEEQLEEIFVYSAVPQDFWFEEIDEKTISTFYPPDILSDDEIYIDHIHEYLYDIGHTIPEEFLPPIWQGYYINSPYSTPKKNTSKSASSICLSPSSTSSPNSLLDEVYILDEFSNSPTNSPLSSSNSSLLPASHLSPSSSSGSSSPSSLSNTNNQKNKNGVGSPNPISKSTFTSSFSSPSRRDEPIFAPRSLFDRPSAALAKLRRDYKIQKMAKLTGGNSSGILGSTSPNPSSPTTSRFLGSKTLGPGSINFSITFPTKGNGSSPGSLIPLVSGIDENIEWIINEDNLLLQSMTSILELPISLITINVSQTPNWDFASDMVNSLSPTYRSIKQCKARYEQVVQPREEGRYGDPFSPASSANSSSTLSPSTPTKKKKGKAASLNSPQVLVSPSSSAFSPQTPIKGVSSSLSPQRKLKTNDLVANDNNSTYSQLFQKRFAKIREASKEQFSPNSTIQVSPAHRHTKQSNVFSEYNISYDNPLSAVTLSAMKNERYQAERAKQAVAVQRAYIQAELARAAAASSSSSSASAINIISSSSTVTPTPMQTLQQIIHIPAQSTSQSVVQQVVTPPPPPLPLQHTTIVVGGGNIPRSSSILQGNDSIILQQQATSITPGGIGMSTSPITQSQRILAGSSSPTTNVLPTTPSTSPSSPIGNILLPPGLTTISNGAIVSMQPNPPGASQSLLNFTATSSNQRPLIQHRLIFSQKDSSTPTSIRQPPIVISGQNTSTVRPVFQQGITKPPPIQIHSNTQQQQAAAAKPSPLTQVVEKTPVPPTIPTPSSISTGDFTSVSGVGGEVPPPSMGNIFVQFTGPTAKLSQSQIQQIKHTLLQQGKVTLAPPSPAPTQQQPKPALRFESPSSTVTSNPQTTGSLMSVASTGGCTTQFQRIQIVGGSVSSSPSSTNQAMINIPNTSSTPPPAVLPNQSTQPTSSILAINTGLGTRFVKQTIIGGKTVNRSLTEAELQMFFKARAAGTTPTTPIRTVEQLARESSGGSSVVVSTGDGSGNSAVSVSNETGVGRSGPSTSVVVVNASPGISTVGSTSNLGNTTGTIPGSGAVVVSKGSPQLISVGGLRSTTSGVLKPPIITAVCLPKGTVSPQQPTQQFSLVRGTSPTQAGATLLGYSPIRTSTITPSTPSKPVTTVTSIAPQQNVFQTWFSYT